MADDAAAAGPSEDSEVANFVSITGSDEDVAAFYLAASNNRFERAIAMFYGNIRLRLRSTLTMVDGCPGLLQANAAHAMKVTCLLWLGSDRKLNCAVYTSNKFVWYCWATDQQGGPGSFQEPAATERRHHATINGQSLSCESICEGFL